MATNDLLKILGAFAGVSGAGLGVFLGVIYFKFRKEIQTGEKIRAAQKLHLTSATPRAAQEHEHEPEPEMVGRR